MDKAIQLSRIDRREGLLMLLQCERELVNATRQSFEAVVVEAHLHQLNESAIEWRPTRMGDSPLSSRL